MERIIVKLNSFKEAENADIFQQISLSPEERQEIAKILKKRVYGENPPDVRDSVNHK
jgi:hypothetical protein